MQRKAFCRHLHITLASLAGLLVISVLLFYFTKTHFFIISSIVLAVLVAVCAFFEGLTHLREKPPTKKQRENGIALVGYI